MASSRPGYQFLKKVRLLEYLAGVMKNEDGAESALSVCAAIEFFGKLASTEVQPFSHNLFKHWILIKFDREWM